MIDIEDAIMQSKNMHSVGNPGSSDCFDFGDTVLIKYVNRGCEEEVMEGVNLKASQGVHIPRYLSIKRLNENGKDVCYVLQDKCKGRSGIDIHKDSLDITYEEMIESLKYVNNIPYEHLKKLVHDGIMCMDLGHETARKNFFYDEETGFWFIDFLAYDKNRTFDPNDLWKVMLAYQPGTIVHPYSLISMMEYEKLKELPSDKRLVVDNYRYLIASKYLLAFESEIPQLKKYEKFILSGESDGYKQYLMDNGIVDKDLFNLNEEDYTIFDEIYNDLIKKYIEDIKNGLSFPILECNFTSGGIHLFGLENIWLIHKDNKLNSEDFKCKYLYEMESIENLKVKLLTDISKNLELLQTNDNINKYLKDYDKWCIEHGYKEEEKKEENVTIQTPPPEFYLDFNFPDEVVDDSYFI